MLYRDCFALAHCVSLYILSVVIIHTYYQRSQHLAGLSGMALPRRDFDDSGSTTVLPGALITVNCHNFQPTHAYTARYSCTIPTLLF